MKMASVLTTLQCRLFGEAGDCVVECLRGVFDIVGIDTAHADATGFQQVDVVLVDEAANLRLRQTGVWKHADLVDDVLPGARGLEPEIIRKTMLIFLFKTQLTS